MYVGEPVVDAAARVERRITTPFFPLEILFAEDSLTLPPWPVFAVVAQFEPLAPNPGELP